MTSCWCLARCATLPLLSQQFLEVHGKHPPRCKTLGMMAPVTPAMLSQFQWLARGVEELRARLPEDFDLRNALAGEEDEDFNGMFDGELDPPHVHGLAA